MQEQGIRAHDEAQWMAAGTVSQSHLTPSPRTFAYSVRQLMRHGCVVSGGSEDAINILAPSCREGRFSQDVWLDGLGSFTLAYGRWLTKGQMYHHQAKREGERRGRANNTRILYTHCAE